MSTLINDIKFARRMLTKRPGFTAIALITLAIGIGANTIMFGLVNGLLLQPANVKEPDRLVGCRSYGFLQLPYSAYVDLRDDNPIFSDLIAHDWRSRSVALQYRKITRRASAMIVSANYFTVLGVTPARGRGFWPEEERVGAEPVVVLSYRTWQRQGGDPNIMGKQVSINGTLFQVIGVAPERFTGTALIGPDLWLPLGVYDLVTYQPKNKAAQATIDDWDYPRLLMVGRLKPGLSMSVAETYLPALTSRLRERFPDRQDVHRRLYLHRLARMNAYSDGDQKQLSIGSLFLMGVSAIVLLIACLNLANMYVIQGACRHREIAIRMAIGGGRMRIIRQFFIESVLLALLGGAFGLVLAFWGMKILNASLGALWFSAETGPAVKGSIDISVLAATLGFCLIAAFLSGVRPALRLSRRDIIEDMKESRNNALRSTTKAHQIMPRGLSVAGQVALSVVLVMSASLLSHSAWRAAHITPGYSFNDKLLIEVEPRRAGYDNDGNLQICMSLMDRLDTLPGIQAVGLSTSTPFDVGSRSIREYRTDSNSEIGTSGWSNCQSIDGNYFNVMGLPLLRGRYFSRIERTTDAPVSIIDEAQARRLRPDGNALGCLIEGIGDKPRQVIGIVPGVRSSIFSTKIYPHVYISMSMWHDLESFRSSVYIYARTTSSVPGGKKALFQNIRTEIHRVDPHVAILSMMSLSDVHRHRSDVRQVQFAADLAMVFGAMALFLAALGIYGVKGFMVATRTPEIGIRMALGATRGKILGLVFREGATLTLVGMAVGMLLAFAAARVMSHALCGVDPIDPVSIVVTLTLLGGASLLASCIPASRAAKIDPMEALRYE